MKQKDPDDVLNSIPEDLRGQVLEFLSKVLEIERSKLHMGNPRNINEEIIKALEDLVK